MTLTITMSTDSAALCDNVHYASARTIRTIAALLELGNDGGNIIDDNGVTVGQWSLTVDSDAEIGNATDTDDDVGADTLTIDVYSHGSHTAVSFDEFEKDIVKNRALAISYAHEMLTDGMVIIDERDDRLTTSYAIIPGGEQNLRKQLDALEK